MSFCSNCGNKIEENSKFCSACGTAVAAPVAETPVAPVEAAPVAPVAVAAQPVAAEPVVSGGTKALGIVGMALGIFGLVMAVIGVLYTMLFLAMEVEGAGFGFAMVFAIFTLPECIIGKILSNKSMDAGNTSAMCSVGSKLSLVGIILTGVMLFLGFLSIVMYA